MPEGEAESINRDNTHLKKARMRCVLALRSRDNHLNIEDQRRSRRAPTNDKGKKASKLLTRIIVRRLCNFFVQDPHLSIFYLVKFEVFFLNKNDNKKKG